MPFSQKSIKLLNLAFPQFEAKSEKFSRLYDLIVDTNDKINVTSITDEVPFLCKHLIDSLAYFKAEESIENFSEYHRICDMGCGGGFPGLPIAIADDNARLTMIDSTEKKIRFLGENADLLSLNNVEAISARGEDICNDKKYRGSFDIAVSRAVARLSVLSEICLPLVRAGGYFIALKGSKAFEELSECKDTFSKLGGKFIEAKRIILPELDLGEFSDEDKNFIDEYCKSDRYLIIVKKIKETDPKYPRNWSQITKKPL